MGDIAKSIELYELIIERLKKSGNAPNQLVAYEGSLECIRGCATAEEATAALAASPWYTAVAQGLALDDLAAKRKAAEELGMADVVAAYDDKIKEVQGDYLKAWETSYVTNIQNLVAAHYNAKEAEIKARLDAIEARVKEFENASVDASADWEAAKAHKAEVVEIGKSELAKVTRGSAICTAPADNTGKYSFECSAKGVF